MTTWMTKLLDSTEIGKLSDGTPVCLRHLSNMSHYDIDKNLYIGIEPQDFDSLYGNRQSGFQEDKSGGDISYLDKVILNKNKGENFIQVDSDIIHRMMLSFFEKIIWPTMKTFNQNKFKAFGYFTTDYLCDNRIIVKKLVNPINGWGENNLYYWSNVVLKFQKELLL